MKNLVLFATALLMSIVVMAQQKSATISWEKTSHDFGTFKEESGTQAFSFNFTNTGSEPLIVTNVRASCGCTATEWTKEPVQPGKKGYVKATYDPRNRPGKFDKSITVTTNTEQPNHVLRILGNVIAREKGLIDLYPKELGDIRMKTSHLAFVKVFNTKKAVDSIPIVNMGTANAKITFQNVPAHISIKVVPETLKGRVGNDESGQKGSIIVTYDGTKQKDFGFLMDRVTMVINGTPMQNDRISISATVEEDFSHLTPEERARAPKMSFESTEFNFGKIKSGDSQSYEFKFTNTGKSDLVIRKIKASCGCTATSPEKMVIKPGESSKIGTTFNSAGKKGNQNKTITVITNDPDNPSVILKVKGEVTE